ncbi:MAG TPA: DUF362 domain-containing protein [Armatimonadota bacterium]|nr:DUF362 domain-containing protein [Armatimonadota bacterium]
MDKFTRREFLRRAGIIGAATCGLTLAGDELLEFLEEAEAASPPTLSVASDGSAEALVKKAIDGLGGIKKFVKRGNSVVIKPNLAWARIPHEAATTNPQVISALIKLCKQAGASRIIVLEHTCDSAAVTFKLSGAQGAVAGTGARLISADRESMYRRISIPKGKILKSDDCAREVLDADVFINVPIAKVHDATTVTASMKNLMGTNRNRQRWHMSDDLEQCIADYSSAVKPDLIVLDALRVLVTRGPKGPGKTKDIGKIAACTDPVAIDAYASTLVGKSPREVKHIVYAASMGLGQIDLKKVNTRKV